MKSKKGLYVALTFIVLVLLLLVIYIDKNNSNLTSNSNTDNWRTYTNQEFGFEFQLPTKWKNADIEHTKDVYYGGDVFDIKLESNVDNQFRNVCSIAVYSKSNWELQNKERELNKLNYLDENSDLVFGSNCGHEDIGYVGFEDYDQALEQGKTETYFDVMPKDKILGPFAEFKFLILPTFKLL